MKRSHLSGVVIYYGLHAKILLLLPQILYSFGTKASGPESTITLEHSSC